MNNTKIVFGEFLGRKSVFPQLKSTRKISFVVLSSQKPECNTALIFLQIFQDDGNQQNTQ